MIEEKTMGITTTLKKTYPRKPGRPPWAAPLPGGDSSPCNGGRIARGSLSPQAGLLCPPHPEQPWALAPLVPHPTRGCPPPRRCRRSCVTPGAERQPGPGRQRGVGHGLLARRRAGGLHPPPWPTMAGRAPWTPSRPVRYSAIRSTRRLHIRATRQRMLGSSADC